MNKVINVNLAGLAFTFDEEAYAQLDDYLARLDDHFAHNPGRSEIMRDIEARLSELFSQGLHGRTIVSTADVRAAIATLGQPEALGGDLDADDQAADTANGYESYDRGGKRRYANGHRAEVRFADDRHSSRPDYGYSSYGRRLMRDSEDKVVAGVCSGLSAYFGIDNPVWLRLAFAVAFFGAGIGLLPYIVLWIIMPVARTPKDRLAMRGEPIDLEHISRQVEYEANAFTDNVRQWGDDLRREKPWSKGRWKQSFDNFTGGSRYSRPPRNAEEFRRRQRDEGYMV